MSPMALRLKKNEDIRLKQGHLWIYSNEVNTAITPFSNFQPGQLVRIEDAQAKPLGLGYVNPHTLLSARLLTRDADASINQQFFEQRLEGALALRTALFDQPFYRLVYGEADSLPGLIVDRYGEHLVVQITTAGMEALKSILCDALQAVIKPRSILWRNDHGMRRLEGLPEYVEPALGEPPAEIEIEENGVRFCIAPGQGQKTGWFYDHRRNRAALKDYVTGRRVLDLFSYIGGWGIQAAVWGAREVWAADASAAALAQLAHNAALNGVDKKVQTLQGDVFELLKTLHQNQERFDVIILDPPAFIKKRKDQKAGFIAYKRLNEMAMRLLNPGGFFISASCSQHLAMDQLREVVLAASLKNKYQLQILDYGGQGPDHPIHPAIPETEYLKAMFCRAM
jgi:23S rRNA (cytosine1962-C5)-methyltransferase